MSFMAGFGQAFSRSFENSQQRRQQQEDDIFKLTFNTYLENQKNEQKEIKADQARVREAEAVADLLGAGVNKKAAVAAAYKFLNSGMSQDKVLEELRKPGTQMDLTRDMRENKDELEAQTEAVTAPGPSTQRNQNLQEVQRSQTDGTQPKEPSWRDNFSGGLFNSPYSKRDSAFNKAQQRIAQSTGRSVEEVNSVLTGSNQRKPLIDTTGLIFSPGSDPAKAPKSAKEALLASQEAFSRGDTSEGERLRRIYDTYMQAVGDEEKAKLDAELAPRVGAPTKVWNPEKNEWDIVSLIPGQPDENGRSTLMNSSTGQPVNPEMTQGIHPDEAKAAEAVRSGLQKDMISHANATASFGNVVHAMDRVLEIGRNNPEALTYYTSSGAGIVNNLMQEGVNLYNMGLEIINPAMEKGLTSGKFDEAEFSKAKNSVEKGLQTLEDDVVKGKISRVAADAARIKMYTTLMTYEVGMAYGQEGRSFTGEKFRLFQEVLSDSVEPQRQLQALSELMLQLEGNLDRNSQQLFGSNSPLIQGFYERYRYNPLGNVAKPVSEVVIANDPRLQQAYDFMKGSLQQSGVIQRDPTQGPQNPMPQPGQMSDPAPVEVFSVEDLQTLAPGTKFIIPDGPNKGKIGTVPRR